MDLQTAYNLIDRAVTKAEMTRNEHIEAINALNIFKNLIESVKEASKNLKKSENKTETNINPEPISPTQKIPEAGAEN